MPGQLAAVGEDLAQIAPHPLLVVVRRATVSSTVPSAPRRAPQGEERGATGPNCRAAPLPAAAMDAVASSHATSWAHCPAPHTTGFSPAAVAATHRPTCAHGRVMECTGGWCGVHRRRPRIGGERRDGREGKGGMICGMRKGHKDQESVIHGRDWEWVWGRVEFSPVKKKTGKLRETF